MIRMKIDLNDELLRELEARLSIMAGGGLPATNKALEAAARKVQTAWHEFVIGKRDLPGVEPLKSPQGGLSRTIKSRKIGPFQHEVFSESKIMEYLIDGTSEVDMKETHTKGPRSRVTERKIKGQKETEKVSYVIVPFRWGTPKTVGFRNVMPLEIYDIVKKKNFEKSVVAKSTHNEPNAKGEDVERWDYEKWGNRLSMKQIIESDDGGMDTNQMFNMKGMVRMDTSSVDKKYSGYYTFRVISSKKPVDWDKRPHKKSWEDTWVKPAVQGKPIIQGLINATQEDVKNLIEFAVKKDLGL
jgi:hypothetical protein